MTHETMPVLPTAEADAIAERLAAAGARVLIGTMVDMAGVARAKSVPLARAGTFHRAGLGAAPSWAVFCIDNWIALSEELSAVGDLRLRADLSAAAVLEPGFAWAPTETFDQRGLPWPGCARGRLRQLQAQAASRGLEVLVGSELEFVVTAADGSALPAGRWQAYGLGALLGQEALVADLYRDLQAAGLQVEQLHAEYARHQFEISLAPAAPLAAADSVVLARLVIARTARRHGLLVSFSPQPVAGDGGNGAHQHLSLARAGVPLMSGGDGPHGLTDEGAAALAGIVAGLPELLGVFAGSALSSFRLQPGHWSGAFACWGLENREAAVRFCAATPGNPHGANVELKCIDPSSNPYLSAAAMIGLALHGLAERLALPPEVTVDPARLAPSAAAAAGITRLPAAQAEAIGALRHSKLAEEILGGGIVRALVAVRTHEIEHYRDTPEAELTELFRFAWSS
jgi:glutamine synthetase